MRVEFENSRGERREIGTAENGKECWKIISDFLDDHNFKSYYQRISEDNGSLWIDVGSHTEFFWVVDDDKKLTIKDWSK